MVVRRGTHAIRSCDPRAHLPLVLWLHLLVVGDPMEAGSTLGLLCTLPPREHLLSPTKLLISPGHVLYVLLSARTWTLIGHLSDVHRKAGKERKSLALDTNCPLLTA